jgi:hypothetical protein
MRLEDPEGNKIQSVLFFFFFLAQMKKNSLHKETGPTRPQTELRSPSPRTNLELEEDEFYVGQNQSLALISKWRK